MQNTTTSHISKKVGKFKNIELLRFIFAWTIVVFHMSMSVTHTPLKSYCHSGYLCVEFFFIVSFFFLIRGLKVEQSMTRFIRDKWIRMAPLAIVITIVGYVLYHLGYCAYSGWNFSAVVENCLLLFGWSAKTSKGCFIGPIWYCSIYLGIAVFYLGLLKTFPHKYVPFIVGVLAYIAWRGIALRIEARPFGVFFGGGDINGACRGMFCLGLAYMAVCLYESGSLGYCANRCRTIICTTAELLILGVLSCKLIFSPQIISTFLTDLLFLFLFVLFISRAGYVSRLLERNWCAYLGRYSYAIYVVHMLVLYVTITIDKKCGILQSYPSETTVGIFLAIMILAVMGHHFVEAPIVRYFKKQHRE